MSSDWYARVSQRRLDTLERSGLRAEDQLVALRLQVESSQQLTDGYISGSRLARAQASRLVSAGVLAPVKGGYEIVGFHDLEPSAESVRAKRDQWRQRQRRRRSKDPADSVPDPDPPVTRDSRRDVTRESPTEWLEVSGERLVGAEDRPYKSTAGAAFDDVAPQSRRRKTTTTGRPARSANELPQATRAHLCVYVRKTCDDNPHVTMDELIAGAQAIYNCSDLEVLDAHDSVVHTDPLAGPSIPNLPRLPASSPASFGTGNPFDEVIGPDASIAAAVETERARDAEVFEELMADRRQQAGGYQRAG